MAELPSELLHDSCHSNKHYCSSASVIEAFLFSAAKRPCGTQDTAFWESPACSLAAQVQREVAVVGHADRTPTRERGLRPALANLDMGFFRAKWPNSTPDMPIAELPLSSGPVPH